MFLSIFSNFQSMEKEFDVFSNEFIDISHNETIDDMTIDIVIPSAAYINSRLYFIFILYIILALHWVLAYLWKVG